MMHAGRIEVHVVFLVVIKEACSVTAYAFFRGLPGSPRVRDMKAHLIEMKNAWAAVIV